MKKIHDITFPNESENYRTTRNELLKDELELRRKIETIAQLKKKLPLGGELKENYIFEETDNSTSDEVTRRVEFSSLFEDLKESLIAYSFMFSPDAEKPCPACTSFIDGLNGLAPHIASRVNLVIIARAPVHKIMQWARSRNWHQLRFLSSRNNNYNLDYFGEDKQGNQQPVLNVFTRSNGKIYHYYSTELLFAPTEPGQHPRHIDLYWPIWSLFEITPEGRGTDWFPKYSYSSPD